MSRVSSGKPDGRQVTVGLGEHQIILQVEDLTPDKPVYRVVQTSERDKIHKALCSHQRFGRDYFLKWFQQRNEAKRELFCLHHVGRGPYFHRFPWVYPDLLEGESADGRRGIMLLIEFIKAPKIKEHFRQMYRRCAIVS